MSKASDVLLAPLFILSVNVIPITDGSKSAIDLGLPKSLITSLF